MKKMMKMVKGALLLALAVCGLQAVAGTAKLEAVCVPSGVGTVEGDSKWR